MVKRIFDNYYEIIPSDYIEGDLIAVQSKPKWKIYRLKAGAPGLVIETALSKQLLEFLSEIDPLFYNIVSDKNPTINNDYDIPGITWYNYETGETFKLSTKRMNNYPVWVGDQGTIVSYSTISKVDIFDDGNCIALYPLDKDGTDLSGNYNGKIIGNVYFRPGLINNAAYSSWWGQIQIDDLPFSARETEEATISAYIKWNGIDNVMPFGFDGYDIYVCAGGWLGFNTANGDLYGFPFRKYRNKWVHILARFTKNSYGRIWINGKEQELKQRCGRINHPSITSKFAIFGWRRGGGYQNFGAVNQLRIFKKLPSEDQIKFLATEKDRL